jgi:hypothetical protein
MSPTTLTQIELAQYNNSDASRCSRNAKKTLWARSQMG